MTSIDLSSGLLPLPIIDMHWGEYREVSDIRRKLPAAVRGVHSFVHLGDNVALGDDRWVRCAQLNDIVRSRYLL